MILVNYEDCNGCGDCVEICPCDAIFLQNETAIIDQENCEGCQVCIDTCPRGAIVCTEKATHPTPVVMMPDSALVKTSEKRDLTTGPTSSIVLSAISSVLLWAGRELIPRLADIALQTLDQRILSSNQEKNQSKLNMREARNSRSGGVSRRRLRRRRNQRMKTNRKEI
jgi:Fe-S-cluster-containing hydrogenase component 2